MNALTRISKARSRLRQDQGKRRESREVYCFNWQNLIFSYKTHETKSCKNLKKIYQYISLIIKYNSFKSYCTYINKYIKKSLGLHFWLLGDLLSIEYCKCMYAQHRVLGLSPTLLYLYSTLLTVHTYCLYNIFSMFVYKGNLLYCYRHRNTHFITLFFLSLFSQHVSVYTPSLLYLYSKFVRLKPSLLYLSTKLLVVHTYYLYSTFLCLYVNPIVQLHKYTYYSFYSAFIFSTSMMDKLVV